MAACATSCTPYMLWFAAGFRCGRSGVRCTPYIAVCASKSLGDRLHTLQVCRRLMAACAPMCIGTYPTCFGLSQVLDAMETVCGAHPTFGCLGTACAMNCTPYMFWFTVGFRYGRDGVQCTPYDVNPMVRQAHHFGSTGSPFGLYRSSNYQIIKTRDGK